MTTTMMNKKLRL